VSELKDRLRSDLTTAIRGRDEVATATLRMALAAITTEEVAGSDARELSDDEVVRVLARESKKRREAAEAFGSAGREELAERERAEGTVLERYLPTQLDDAAVSELVAASIAETGASGMQQMGAVMRVAQQKAAGRADGKRLSTEVRRQLSG
jgi:uncharacterized protein YqeY